MQRNRWLKVIFIGIFVVATTAIAVNFFEKLDRRPEAPTVEPLAPSTAQISHDVEFKSYAGRDMVFQVRSELNHMNQDGIQDLEGVNLSIFRPPDRALADQVWAEGARYDEGRRTVEFEKNVSILLEDGTRIRSERAAADLEGQTVRIEDSFSLSRGEVNGSGQGLLYEAGENRLEVHRGIALRIPGNQGAVQVRAGEAIYWPRSGRLLLSRDCRLADATQDLVAEELDLELTEEKKLRRAVAVGGVVLTGQDTLIQGDRLSLTFEPERGRVLSFRLAAESPQRRALYRRGKGEGAQILQAGLITGIPGADGRPGEILLSRLQASGDLQIEWREAGIDRVTAERMKGLSSGGVNFDELLFEGRVELVRQSGRGEETIRSGELSVALTDKLLQGLVARERPVLVAADGSLHRRLEAETQIAVVFEDGSPARLDTLGPSQFREESSGETTWIRSAGLRTDYENGVPVSMLASGPVRLEKGQERPLVAEADEMRVTYDTAGGLQKVELVGDLELKRDAKDGSIELAGEHAVISRGGQLVEVTGGPLALLKNLTADREIASRTIAPRFQLDLSTQGVQASGQVKTEVVGDEPLTIQAGRMEAGGESSWVLYEGRPRLEFGENRIESNRMRLESEQLLLEAEGQVEAIVRTVEGETPVSYRVDAERLELDRRAREAVFSGDVRADSDKFDVEASRMTLRFEGSDLRTLLEMRAAGAVRLSEEGRLAQGEEALYLPSEGKVTVTGERAQVVDSKQGKAIGRTLTFTLGDDTLLIEGQP